MILRPLTPEDGARLLDLRASIPLAPEQDALDAALAAALEGGAAFGAEEGEQLVGAILLAPSDAEPFRVLCGVRPSHERRGIGSLLLRMADDWAWEKGAACLQLALHKEDLVARAFFDKHGYRSAGFRRGVLDAAGQPFDELLLEKRLEL